MSGFWHGANWTFIAWGALNALYFLPLMLLNKNRQNLDVTSKDRHLPSLREFVGIVSTFGLTTFAWIFFRAEDINHAQQYISEIFSASLFTIPIIKLNSTLLLLPLFIIIEWIGRNRQYPIEHLGLTWHRSFRWAMYLFFIVIIFSFGGQQQEFIYFQF